MLADNALMGGFASQTKPVDAAIVREVARDFDFGVGAVASAPPFSLPSVTTAPPHNRAPRVSDEDTASVDAMDDGLGAGRAPAPLASAAGRKKRFLFF